MTKFELDTKNFDKDILAYELAISGATLKGTIDVANEILRLSNPQVPHDIGLLQGSGHVEPQDDGAIVGYNKVYAARLHEHPEYKFQKGRKGKYLEDPIIENMAVFEQFLGNKLNQVSN